MFKFAAKKTDILFSVALFLLVAVTALSTWWIYDLREAIHETRRAVKLYDLADDIRKMILAAESSQRGYLLTNNKDYIAEYKAVTEKLEVLLTDFSTQKRTQKLRLDEAEVAEVYLLAHEKLNRLHNTIEFKERGQTKEVQKLLNSDYGLKLVQGIDKKLLNLEEKARTRMENHNNFIKAYSNNLTWLIIIGSLFAGGLLIANIILTKKQIKIRELEKEEVSQARLLAQQSSDLKSKFLATVSHEIRTPLNGIIGLSDVLRKGKLEVRIPILGVVENMSYFLCDGCDKRHYIFGSEGGKTLSRKFNTELLAQIPIVQQVREAGDEGRPIVIRAPESAVARSFRDLARKVAQQVSILDNQAIDPSQIVQIGKF